MTIENMTKALQAGVSPAASLYCDLVKFAGDAVYPYEGTADIEGLVRTAVSREVTLVGVIGQQCGVYEPVITETPASLVDGVASYPVADQDGNTLIYKLNGADAVTETLSGGHTTAAHIVATLTAITGIESYVDGDGAAFVKTDRRGAAATLEITGGTANAVYLFSTAVNYGSDDKLLVIKKKSDGANAGSKTATADLSGTNFDMVVLSK
jgi:hypothetical protein